MVRRSAALLALLALLALGCGREPEPTPRIDVPIPETEPTATGPNAFGAYSNLARRAIEDTSLSLDVRDTPGNRKKAIAEMSALLEELSSATHLPCDFRFEPTGPFGERPLQLGWLYLARALVWRIEQAIEDSDWQQAAEWTVVAHVFGADLAGGSVSDASLGYGLMDGARRAIARSIPLLPDSALTTLENGISRALARMPDADSTITNESVLMLTAVRELQDDPRTFAQELYGPPKDAVKEYQAMEGPDQAALIQALVDEANEVVEQAKARATVPAARRGSFEMESDGPARVLAEQFFGSVEPWLGVRDTLLARTRLLLLTVRLTRALRAGELPKDLAGFGEHATDPFTGLPFGYLALARDFLVYSYGIDGKDDRGDTDSARNAPDLLLEDR